jgi:hypothetical protein
MFVCLNSGVQRLKLQNKLDTPTYVSVVDLTGDEQPTLPHNPMKIDHNEHHHRNEDPVDDRIQHHNRESKQNEQMEIEMKHDQFNDQSVSTHSQFDLKSEMDDEFISIASEYDLNDHNDTEHFNGNQVHKQIFNANCTFHGVYF